MKLIEALQKLTAFNQAVLATKDVAAILDISNAYASQILIRLQKANMVLPVKQGLWIIDKTISQYQLAAYLTKPFPCYISLQTALYFHGIISQMSAVIYVVTLARSHQLTTKIATYSFHHIKPEFFFDYTIDPELKVAMASPEKALIDYLYLIPARSKKFHSLPEIELPSNFDFSKAEKIITKIDSKRTRSLVIDRFRTLS